MRKSNLIRLGLLAIIGLSTVDIAISQRRHDNQLQSQENWQNRQDPSRRHEYRSHSRSQDRKMMSPRQHKNLQMRKQIWRDGVMTIPERKLLKKSRIHSFRSNHPRAHQKMKRQGIRRI